MEPSFIVDLVDEMMRVPDGASIAPMLWLEKQLGRKAGSSTGTNVWSTLQVAKRMREAGRSGSIVTLQCDSGDHYLETCYHPDWVAEHIGDVGQWQSDMP